MLDVPVAAIEKDDLPYAVSSLLNHSEMEKKPLSECFEEKTMWFMSDLDDFKDLYKHELTRHLFAAQEGNLYLLKMALDNILHDMKEGRVHDRPSPAPSSVRSPARLTLVGG